MVTAAESGVRTFLFTDIEGSTRRWDSDPTAMRLALADHDHVLAESIIACEGVLFKHTGDGVCAVFAKPETAIDAAVLAQAALALPVRMGIATGDAERRGEDYFGPALNRAARIMSAGHGGQILIDGVTAATPTPMELIDLGRRQLRDISQPVHIFQVGAPGLRDVFPPLRVADRTAGNLRLPPGSLIGRERDIERLRSIVRSHRMVTLTGVGGVGKTRVALAVAGQVCDQFPDGVWVFELAALSDPGAIPGAVAAVLGITQQVGQSLAESIAAAQAARRRLLIFDNCEHVLNATADLMDLILTASDTVRILATSREGLGVADEQLFPVFPLDVDAGATCAAATLFTHRAAAVAPIDEPMQGHQLDIVVDLCRRLDGIPLAIELAASRMHSMTARELRDRLDDRFRILIGSGRTDNRHRTLHNAVQWSYELLTPSEAALLQQCSVFAGGFTLQAAAAVSRTEEYSTLQLLDSLVRKSLVVSDRTAQGTRFSMLETIRQFAAGELSGAGRTAEFREAHARYFAGQETHILAIWDSPQQLMAFHWLTTELPNLRQAFRWSAEHGHIETAGAIAGLAGFLGGWIELHEPALWAEELLPAARSTDHPRLRQLYVVASECYRTGDIERALRYAQACVHDCESPRYGRLPADIEPTALGGTYITKGLADSWLSLCRSRLEEGRGDNAFNRGSLIMALMTAGQIHTAQAAADDLITRLGATDNPGGTAYALMSCGYAWRDTRPEQAYDALRRGLKIAQDSGNRMAESYIAMNLSGFATTLASTAESLDFLTLAIRNFYDSGTYTHLVGPLGILAAILDRADRHDAAALLLGFSANTFAFAVFPEISESIAHVRQMLGDDTYESRAAAGAQMSTASAAAYALQQIALIRDPD